MPWWFANFAGCYNRVGKGCSIGSAADWFFERFFHIPALLKILLVEGSIITIDAMGCQKNIAKTIRSKKADYILAVKVNQSNLSKEIIDLFEKVKRPECASYIQSVDTQVDKDHGRIENRQCMTIENLGWLFEINQWEDARSISKITATVIRGGLKT